MGYNKGQILFYEFPEKDSSKVINGFHRVVVLHSRETPYKTILVAPVTSSEGLNSKNKVPSNYVSLLVKDYPFALDHDSFINLDMTMPIDEYDLKCLEKFNKKIKAELTSIDMYQLDYKIALTYELNKYFETQISLELKNVVKYIDENIKVRIEDILAKVSDEKLIEDIIGIIDDLISELKENYIIKKL